MKNEIRKNSIRGAGCILAFSVLTVLLGVIDVRPLGVNGTDIGFAGINTGFHALTGTDMTLYTVTDWLGLVPLFVCMAFGVTGLLQLIKRRSLLRVDGDILISGAYYIVVIICYFAFEMIPVNYRPVLINGIAEISYPSSTTLLVLCVMPTLVFLTGRRLECAGLKKLIFVITVLFSVFMVTGRLLSGVHWLSDIAGAVLFSAGLFSLYKALVLWADSRKV